MTETMDSTATAATARAVASMAVAITTDETAFRLVYDSPFGPLVLVGDDESITHLFLPNTGLATAGSTPGPVPEALGKAMEQLDEYFAGTRSEFDLPLRFTGGTAFQQSVWRALAEIPYGQTISYAELAARVDRPGAFRAVGQANGANPLAIIFPCHRVIAAGGGLGGYGGGLHLKQQLLDLEANAAAG
ncbi:MAG TPA: methylated-DNA--[protein]-cysteine S-methyltransferase [Acidimicrobiales bacterium]|jgi:methylated-DNA-[protein]-cysteine S-methyltransferase|nr:methylated-DNA--[protein]-cysteine S-methyltransferase [Acidimicrobiales bacterium]